MEILNNLWMAISTPNEVLLNLLLIPAGIIENFLIMTLFTTLINLNTTKKKKILYVSATTIISLINMNLIKNPFNILLNYFIMIIIAYKIFKVNLGKTCIVMVSTALLFNILGALILNPYLTILHITAEQLSTIPIYRLFYVLLIYVTCILLIFIIKYRNLKIEFVDNIDRNSKIIIIIKKIIILEV